MNAQPANLSGSQEALFAQYMPLVKMIVGTIWRRLPPHADFDDLLQAGTIGLWDAVKKFDPEKKVPFECYAKFRIRGAVLDSLRSLDELGRSDRQKVKLRNQEEQPYSGPARLSAFASGSHENSPNHCFMRSTIRVAAASTWDTNESEEQVLDPAATGDSPEQLYGTAVIRKLLAETASGLPPRYQMVINLYYEGDLTMKEIGEVLGVKESRISQMHKSALSKMATALTDRGYQSADMLCA